ncbi:prepilin peptidase [Undibacterium sp. JH2W]|uniref:prepilin peptidase n=1 Tax=Undibacterium sp. JH2W TaxID=3413037 RepID=UPI003BF07624
MEVLLFALPHNGWSTIAFGLLGLLIGSFLNVVIYRLPKIYLREVDNFVAEQRQEKLPHQDKFNLTLPRSACPHCGHQITAMENIPIISYLVIGGKCTGCKAKISIRYPLIEVLTALLSAAMIWHFGSGVAGMGAVVFVWLLISMTFIDLDHKLLLDDLTLSLLWIGLLVNLNGSFVPLKDAVLGACAGYLSLWSIYWAYKLLTGKEGFGYGDFKLLAALGAWMGWSVLPVIILFSCCVGAAIGITQIVFSRMGWGKETGWGTEMPFGPYLTGAGLISLIWGKNIVDFYLSTNQWLAISH